MTPELPVITYYGIHKANIAILNIARKHSENQVVGFFITLLCSTLLYIYSSTDGLKKMHGNWINRIKHSIFSVNCNPSVEGWPGYSYAN